MIFLPVNLMILITQTCVIHEVLFWPQHRSTTIGGMIILIDSDRNPDHIPSQRGVYSAQTFIIVKATHTNNEVSE